MCSKLQHCSAIFVSTWLWGISPCNGRIPVFPAVNERLGQGISPESPSVLNHMSHSLVSMPHKLHGLLLRRCILATPQDLTITLEMSVCQPASLLNIPWLKIGGDFKDLPWISPSYVHSTQSTLSNKLDVVPRRRGKIFWVLGPGRTSLKRKAWIMDGFLFFLKTTID